MAPYPCTAPLDGFCRDRVPVAFVSCRDTTEGAAAACALKNIDVVCWPAIRALQGICKASGLSLEGDVTPRRSP